MIDTCKVNYVGSIAVDLRCHGDFIHRVTFVWGIPEIVRVMMHWVGSHFGNRIKFDHPCECYSGRNGWLCGHLCNVFV